MSTSSLALNVTVTILKSVFPAPALGTRTQTIEDAPRRERPWIAEEISAFEAAIGSSNIGPTRFATISRKVGGGGETRAVSGTSVVSSEHPVAIKKASGVNHLNLVRPVTLLSKCFLDPEFSVRAVGMSTGNQSNQ